MTHDPLCTTVLNTEMSETFCNCDLIARVREDERELHGYRLHDPAYCNGYAAGVSASREAVAGLLGWEDADLSDGYKPLTAIWKFRALAAIDGLVKR